MKQSYSLVTDAASEVFTRNEIKNWLKLDSDITADDSLIDSLIIAVREHTENYLNRSLINQTWKMTMDCFYEYIDITHRANLSSITSVKYYDSDNVQQTLSSSNYQTDFVSLPSRLRVTTIPAIYDRLGAVEVNFVSGYGADESAVPDAIKTAMRLTIAKWYDQRTDFYGEMQIPVLAKTILDPYRIKVF